MANKWADNFDKKTHISIYNLDDLIEVYDGETDDSFTAAVAHSHATERTTVITDINAEIDVIIAAYPGADPGLLADLATLKTFVTSTVNTEFPDHSVIVTKTEVLERIKLEYSNELTTASKDNLCIRCATSGISRGRYPATNDGIDVTYQIHCVTCDGFGASEEPEDVQPVVQNINYPVVERTYAD